MLLERAGSCSTNLGAFGDFVYGWRLKIAKSVPKAQIAPNVSAGPGGARRRWPGGGLSDRNGAWISVVNSLG